VVVQYQYFNYIAAAFNDGAPHSTMAVMHKSIVGAGTRTPVIRTTTKNINHYITPTILQYFIVGWRRGFLVRNNGRFG
jgi:hypothetical protein